MANGQLPLLYQLRHLIRRQGAGVADSELLGRFVGQRDEAAFEVLVWRHGPMVLGVCRRLSLSPHDADDVLQATFLTLLRKAGSIGKRASLASWLYKVAYRIALRARAQAARRSARACPVVDVPAAADADPAGWDELRPLLDAAIERLPEKYRTPIVLCYIQGKTNREVAEQLACPIGTVATRLTRGRAMLRRRLARQGLALSGGSLGLLLTRHAVAGGLPGVAVASTVRAAVACAAGGAAAGLVSVHVASLVQGATRAMLLSKIKLAVMLVATGALLAAGVGTWAVGGKSEGPASARADQPPAAAQAPAARTRAPVVVLAGKVLDPDGRPAAGARLYWPHLRTPEPRTPDDIDCPERGITAGDGTFRLELPRADVSPRMRVPLLAAAPGYGAGWAELPLGKPPTDLVLRLVKDQPVRGRVLTTEGRPVSGAEVRVVGLAAPGNGRLDGFLNAWKREWQLAFQQTDRMAFFPPVGTALLARTGGDGGFTLTGIGAERLAQLQVSGPRIAQASGFVITRAGFDPAPYNHAAQERIPPEFRLPGQPPLLYGPEPTFVAEATKPIEGTVRDAATGKVVAGVSIMAISGYNNGISAKSDASGRFRIIGLPKMKTYGLHCMPPAKSPLLARSVQVTDTEGLEPIRAEIELAAGVVLTGRLIDRATGKGVQGGVRFVPLPDNKYFGKKAGHDSYRHERLMTSTDAQGHFRLPVIPGAGVLMAQAYGASENAGGVRVNPYRLAEFDAADRKRVKVVDPDGDRYFQAAGNSIEFLSTENAAKVLDLPEGTPAVTCDLYVERGRTQAVHVRDADGKPLSGVTVSGLTASWPIAYTVPGSTCKVVALDPAKPRRLVFVHAGRRLAGTLTVRGDEKAPPAVRLAPAGAVTGRLLDADGLPLAGVEVSLSFPDKISQELYRLLGQRQPAVRTDADGRFHLADVAPDVQFGLGMQKGRSFLVGEPRIGLKQVKAGETLDLGDVRTKPVR